LRRLPKLTNPIRPLLVLTAVAAVALPASGCGTTTADPERGRVLFVEKCGVCHTMAQAGTTAQVGPNLDDAFASARAAGENSRTVEGVVLAQVESPRPVTNNSAVSMPPDIVEGQDLDDVAAYVGLYAGVPGAAPPKVPGGPGAQVFANSGCATCHTLAAANSGGVTGPNLDEALPGQSEAMIKEDIVDPNKEIAKGYPPNVMPSNFEQSLSPKDLKDLVEYLIESTSGGKGKTGAAGNKGGGGSQGPGAHASPANG
jgi:mono/diheme cytochrome c family protein